MDILIIVNALACILGGILAVSGLIIANKPDAKQLIDKLTPFQALIGVAMIALGIVNLIRLLGVLTDMFKLNLMWALGIYCMIGAGVALGLLFGMGQLLKLAPNNQAAQQKAWELQQKLAPYQILLGLIALGGAVLVLLFQFGLMKYI